MFVQIVYGELYTVDKPHRVNQICVHNPILRTWKKFVYTNNGGQLKENIFISGKSHYLFMVWFAYDEAVYLTDSEYRDPQGLVSDRYRAWISHCLAK